MARALSLGLRLTANMIEGLAFIFLIFLMININLDLLYFDSIIIYSFIPAVFYDNANTEKSRILSDNKGKAGIYLWEHKESGKKYVGSAVDLSRRLQDYYSTYRLKRDNTYITNSLIHHGHSNFSLTILVYLDILDLSKSESKKLVLESEQKFIEELKPEYNILKFAGNSLGFKHTDKTKELMSIKKLGELNPMFGKKGTMLGKKGKDHPLFGIPLSEETKQRLSILKGTTIYVYSFDGLTLIDTFTSARKAAIHYKVDKKTIISYTKSGKLFKKQWILSTSERSSE
jgi:group I intron endonuclease